MSHAHDGLLPTTYSKRVRLAFEPPLQGEQLRAKLEGFFAALARSLPTPEAALVGHLKGLVEVAEGHLFFSVTSFGRRASFKGKINGEVAGATLTVNAILYGVEGARVERVVGEEIRRYFGEQEKDFWPFP